MATLSLTINCNGVPATHELSGATADRVVAVYGTNPLAMLATMLAAISDRVVATERDNIIKAKNEEADAAVNAVEPLS